MFAKVLWATDGSDQADRALEYAVQIAEHEDVELHAVHVVEKLVGGRITGQNARLNEQEIVAKIKGRVARIAQEQGIQPTLHVVTEAAGHTADRIAETADETGADLIVVGTRGHSALGGLLLGSVTQRLLHFATCPVLAVPPAKVAAANEPHPDALPSVG
jgi:nucleotide-binding universal stress UspA family protein